MNFIKKQSFLLLTVLLLVSACNTVQVPQQQVKTNPLPTVLKKALTAHGGLAKWQGMNTLEYSAERKEKPERHIIDLQSRKVLLKHDDYQLGFDGKEVWVSPNLAAFGKGSPRFYHNLYFYFYTIPFVLADPGVHYEVLPQKELKGQLYNALKVTYGAGVGDAPDDYYIAHFNTETNLMEWLLYTVTYYSGEKNEKFKALHYEWQQVNGLTLPSKLTGYKYEDGKIGDLRYTRPFKNVQIKTTKVNSSIFEMPNGAEIDPLIKH